MSATFTPGPWKVFLDGGQVGDAQAGGICALWRFNPKASSEENAEACANARLIAAAPDLYEALETARSLAMSQILYWQQQGKELPLDHPFRRDLVKFNNALAKAAVRRGE